MNAIEGEQSAAVMAHTVHVKFDAGIISCGADHNVHHLLGFIYSFLSRPHSCVDLVILIYAVNDKTSLPILSRGGSGKLFLPL